MRTRIVAALSTVAALGAAPPAAGATLEVARDCYQERQDVVVRGTGFAPGGRVTVRRDGVAIGTTTADLDGAIAGRFDAARVPGRRREILRRLHATDGGNTAATRYRVTELSAGFSPGAGDPARLRVRFRVNGFALRRPSPAVYVHYVRPDGRVRRSVRLGTATGTCGRIARTRLRRLFPFTAQRGRWVLQFDTNRRYRRGARRSPFVWVRKPVVIARR